MNTLPVAILGATGTVGQKAVALIERHPLFTLSELAASDGRAGQKYGVCVHWREELALPERAASLCMCTSGKITAPYVISCLPAEPALPIEQRLAEAGHWVFSNASAHRMRADVPLLVPEINLNELKRLKDQHTEGKIITNPNCTTVFITLALAPLLSFIPIEHVSVVTLQALSGAGYPGVSALDVLNGPLPHIEGEEEKIARETAKILGTGFPLTVHTNRVSTRHGHTIYLHLRSKTPIELDAVEAAYANKGSLYRIYHDPEVPLAHRHLLPDDQSVHIGRMKLSKDRRTLGLMVLGHNLVRGAAGAALINLEATVRSISSEDSSHRSRKDGQHRLGIDR